MHHALSPPEVLICILGWREYVAEAATVPLGIDLQELARVYIFLFIITFVAW
jgi:hypothetical protein